MQLLHRILFGLFYYRFFLLLCESISQDVHIDASDICFVKKFAVIDIFYLYTRKYATFLLTLSFYYLILLLLLLNYSD